MARHVAALAAAATALALVPATAFAEPVGSVAVSAPVPNAVLASPVEIAGTSSTLGLAEPLGEVTLAIYSGPSPSGSPFIAHAATLAGAWSDTLSIPEGVYTVVASREFLLEGVASDESSSPVTFEVGSAPNVTSNPAGQVAKAGETAQFTAAASGRPAPTIAWEVSTNGGASWSYDGGDSGQGTETLTVGPVTAGESGYEYRAVFTNALGEATSAPARLEVQTAPSVTLDPASTSVPAGAQATFTAEASASPAPSVQWQYSTDGGASWSDDTSDPGNHGDVLTIPSASIGENGVQFRAEFANAAGSAFTSAATLSVHEGPHVTQQPSSATTVEGHAASFTASASGTPAPSVQWEVSVDGGSSWSADTGDAGNASETLTISSPTAAQSGFEYRARFSNEAGITWSSAARLTVQTPPQVTRQPAAITVSVGSSVEFAVAAEGSPSPTVQWQISTDGGSTWTPIGGATSDAYVIGSASLAQSGDQFRAQFANAAGSVLTSAATLTVDEGPRITHEPTAQTVIAGHPASFTASASGTPTPTIAWEVSTDGGSTWAPDTTDAGATRETLTVTAPTGAQNGYLYRAVFTNTSGSATTNPPARLTVQTAPVITANPARATVAPGGKTAFTASASGNPKPSVQWEFSANGAGSWSNVAGAVSETFEIAHAAKAWSGDQFRAVFHNSVGTATSEAAELEVPTRPIVVEAPVGVEVPTGATATFNATVEGVPLPTAQWQVRSPGGSWANDTSDEASPVAVRPHEPTQGTTTLTLHSVSPAQAGYEYRVVFENEKGETATSAAATLTVETAPAVTQQPADATVLPGYTAYFTAQASGTPGPAVAWQQSSNGGASWTPIAGETSTTLTLASVSAALNGRQYRAVFTNALGETTSNAATLHVVAPAAAPSGPAASFSWLPAAPHADEPVSLISTSGDPTSPLVAYAWDVLGTGAFAAGHPVDTVTFATPGPHKVSLRVTAANGQTGTATQTINVGAPRFALMQPFPVVRIAGYDTSRGARLTLVSVLAPAGARITILCKGGGCPSRKPASLVAAAAHGSGVALVVFRRYDRLLRAGTVLQISVSRGQEIGKYTRFAVRAGKLPVRSDACLEPTSLRPMACPT